MAAGGAAAAEESQKKRMPGVDSQRRRQAREREQVRTASQTWRQEMIFSRISGGSESRLGAAASAAGSGDDSRCLRRGGEASI